MKYDMERMLKQYNVSLEHAYQHNSESYFGPLDKVPEMFRVNPTFAFSRRVRATREFLIFENLKHGGTELARELVVEAGQLTVGYFQNLMADGQPLTMRFRRGDLEMVGKGSSSDKGVKNWCRAFWLALINRDTDGLAILDQVGLDIFLDNNGGPDTAFKLTLSNFYKALAKAEPNLTGKLQATLETLETEGCRAYDVQYEGQILLPSLAVLAAVLNEEGEARYNELLQSALEQHQAFWMAWSANDPHSDGLLSLPLTAMASVAYDRAGYRVAEASDFVPNWMVEGQ
ncbi:immunity 49 family protein [Marinobacter xestospongiae]|uniref:immunity 49 family protein n=2 Tax=Marinobacter xestospongiae TaxID=994319 RepID=UPI002002EB7C|nr:immunity 49 family protein [Marinobacter xestospongiae]